MTVVNGVTFPTGPWVPDMAQTISDIGEGLRVVSLAALTLAGFGARYERSVTGTGAVPVEPSRANQLTVAPSVLFLGKAGQKQFQFHDGALGKYALETEEYEIEITHPYPNRQAGRATRTPDVASYSQGLLRDAYIVWAAMKGLALGGVIAPSGTALQIALDKDNGMMVGEMTMKPPKGHEASVVIKVEVQL